MSPKSPSDENRTGFAVQRNMNAERIKQSLAVVHATEKQQGRLEAVRFQRINLTEEEFAVLCRATHCEELLNPSVPRSSKS